MSAEAATLRAQIAAAETRLADLERRPGLTPAIRLQIDKAKDGLRDMRIQLAALTPIKTSPCAHCLTPGPPAWFLCRACMQELPLKLYTHLVGAIGFHHHKLISDAALTEHQQRALSYLKQHSSAIL